MNLKISPNIAKFVYQNKTERSKTENNNRNMQNLVLKNDNVAFGRIPNNNRGFNKIPNGYNGNRNNNNMPIEMIRQLLVRRRQKIQNSINRIRTRIEKINNPTISQNVQTILNTLNNIPNNFLSSGVMTKLKLIDKLLLFKQKGYDEINFAENFLTPEFINNNKISMQRGRDDEGCDITYIVATSNGNNGVSGVKLGNGHEIGNVNSVTFDIAQYENSKTEVFDGITILSKKGESLTNVNVYDTEKSKSSCIQNVYELSHGYFFMDGKDEVFVDFLTAHPENHDEVILNDEESHSVMIYYGHEEIDGLPPAERSF